MIYTVEIDFKSEAHFSDWSAWYNGNLPLILTVPGFETAQRLEAVSADVPRFLAIYTISDADVFNSQAYLAIGGGGTASSKWKEFIKRRRNLFSGMDVAPEISSDALLGIIDVDPGSFDPPDLMFVPLVAEALDRSPKRRYLTIVNDASRMQDFMRAVPGLAFYRALGMRLTSNQHTGRPLSSPT
jgi:hypothetical protein